MKVMYIAHPVGGDISGNLDRIVEIVRRINTNPASKEVVPFVPYYADCLALDDDDFKQRARGISNGLALLSKGFVDELWLYGPRISKGMHEEIAAARKYGIPVVAKSVGTQRELEQKEGRI